MNNMTALQELQALGVKGKSKGFGKVVAEVKKREYKESTEQGSFSGYLKKYHSNVLFQTTRIEGKKEFWEQNQIKKQNSDRGFPDTNIFLAAGGFHGLMIENKRTGEELFQKRIFNRFASTHLAEQYAIHQKLIKQGYAVYFAVGVEQAVQIFEAYKSGKALPFLQVDGFDLMNYL